MRIRTTEVGAAADDGRTATAWFDAASGATAETTDLLTDGAVPELADRVRVAAQSDPRVDPDLLEDELALGAEAFDALAFTVNGLLYVEFDRGHVSATVKTPVALAVDPDGLLSEFGVAARDAAANPSDPALVDVAALPTSRGRIEPSDVDCAVVDCVALTFDDGPVGGTAELLDLLAEKGVRATFFVVGTNAQAQPDLLARMVAEGHVVGNHTFDHPQLSRLDAASITGEITRVNDIVEDATGVTPTLLRPPYGATNEAVAGIAADLGMSQVLWNVDPEDWKDRDSAIVTQRVLANTGPGDIVLSHDIHETTVEAYAAIIHGLQAQGFTLVTVPELLGGQLEPGAKYFNQP